jgi:hypothetical protein
MRQVMVRYRTKADRAEENAGYIEKVFEELKRSRPDGLRYASFRLDDGVTFVHVAEISTADGSNPLAETQAFREFQSELKDRCEEPPVATDLHSVGSFNLFSD